MIGGRRCGKTTILSKIKQHFNEVLHHGADEEEKNDLLRLLSETGEITKLNNAQDCINQLFEEHEWHEEFPVDENPSKDKTVTTFKLEPLKGNGSLLLEFTDIPGEWVSYIEKKSEDEQADKDKDHTGEVKKLIIDSHVIIVAIDTPSLFEKEGLHADYYNRIKDVKELINGAFTGKIFSTEESQKMILFVPLKCEKYIIKNDGTADIEGKKMVCAKVEEHYNELIKNCRDNYSRNVTMAILPIVTIMEVEWASFFALDNAGNRVDIHTADGRSKKFIYGKGENKLFSKYRFKPDLYDAVADGKRESQSLYCEQPLVYTLAYLLKIYSMYGEKKGAWISKIPILGPVLKGLGEVLGLFSENTAFKKEAERLYKRFMHREKNGCKILQNPLRI